MTPLVVFASPEQLSDGATRDFYLDILSTEEQARRARLLSEPKRDLFLLAHGLLRSTLSKCAPVDPAAWQFTTGKSGRPEIAAPASPLRFNLSHTEGLAACVVTDGRDAGIDVENVSPSFSPRVAERVLSPREHAELRDLPPSRQSIRFYELWTLKEAYLKARGIGLAIPLKSVSFYRDEGGEWRIEFGRAVKDDPRRWTFRSSFFGDRHQTALAMSVDQ